MFVCSSGCSAGMALQEGQAVLLEVPLGNGLLSQAEGQLWIPCSRGNQGDIAQFTVPWASREHPAPCQPHSSLAFQYFIIISIKKPLPFILCNFFSLFSSSAASHGETEQVNTSHGDLSSAAGTSPFPGTFQPGTGGISVPGDK